jgi:hypothetical protein
MGYGSRALSILEKYFEGKIPPIDLLELPDGSVDSESAEEADLLNEKIGKLTSQAVVNRRCRIEAIKCSSLCDFCPRENLRRSS